MFSYRCFETRSFFAKETKIVLEEEEEVILFEDLIFMIFCIARFFFFFFFLWVFDKVKYNKAISSCADYKSLRKFLVLVLFLKQIEMELK